MTESRDLERALTETQMSRRNLLHRAAILGISAPIIGSLLAACGGDDGGGDDTSSEEGDDSEAGSGDDESTDSETPEGSEEDPADSGEGDEAAEGGEGEGQFGGRMIAMGHHSIEVLHPDDSGSTVEWVPIKNIHDSLLGVNENYELEEELAESYEVSDDGTTYTFTLREGVVFHDGEDFNAEDVVFTYEWYMNPDNTAILAADYASVDSVEADGDYTVLVNMANPDASFIRRGAVNMIMPEHHAADKDYGEYSQDPVGTGPFRMVEWQPASHVLLEAFEDHWRGRPYLDEFEVRVVEEASVRVIELETGNVDTSIWTQIPEEDVRLANEVDILNSYITSSTAVNHFPMNNTLPVFQEVEVRRAMMHAIDRDAVIQDAFADAAAKATGNLAPTLGQWYEPDVRKYEYDPELAQQMLDDAGWTVGDDGIRAKDGTRLSFECIVLTGDEARRPEAELVAQMLSDVGIEMTIRENPEASGPMRRGELDMALYNWTYGGTNGEPDATITLHTDGGNNFSHYSNEEMDQLLEDGLREVDPAARQEIYSQIQKLFAEEVPFIYMMYWDWFNHFNQRIKGLPEGDISNGSQLFRKVHSFWIEE